MDVSNGERIKSQLTEAVVAFQRVQMSVTAESVWVDLHPGSVVVTVRGAISPAEQSCARDEEGRELLDRFYSHLFEVSKRILEVAIEGILGLSMMRSRLCVDAESGDQEGEHQLRLMSVRDFLSIPLGKYVGNTLDFAGGIREPLLIFGVNCIEGDESGRLANSARDNAVWLKWIERRIHGEAEAIAAPTGYIPAYDDLVLLFREVPGRDYLPEHYVEQFTTRVAESIAKIDRVDEFCRANVPDAPQMLFDVLAVQRERLKQARRQFGDCISPLDIASAGFQSGQKDSLRTQIP